MFRTVPLSMAILVPTGCGVVVDPGEPGEPGVVAVEITAPAIGHEIRDLVTITANAIATEGGVASVQFDLPNGNSIIDRTPPFSTMWDSKTVANGPYRLRATALGHNGAAGSADVGITVANHACVGETTTAQDLPRTIPDANLNGVTSSIQLPGGKVESMAVSVNISHIFPVELDVQLISPQGTKFPIAEHVETDGANIVINSREIAQLAGQEAGGSWRLLVVDEGQGDVGKINSWSLSICL